MKLDVTAKHLAIVREILRKHLPVNSTVWVFGSRAKTAGKKYSDLDLLIDLAGKKLPLPLLSDLINAFDESVLPYKVDIVDWNSITESFKKHIENDRVALNFFE